MALVPIIYGCGMPSLMAPGQNARVLLVVIDRVLPDDVQVKVVSLSPRGGG